MDTQRLDWLAKQDGAALISDDAGHWALIYTGTQSVSDPPQDIYTSFFVAKHEWKPSIREAIDAAMKADGEEE